MRWVLRIVLGLVVLGGGGLAALYFGARSDTPAVPLDAEVDHEDVLRLRAVLDRAGDPRELEVGAAGAVTLSEADLEVIARVLTAQVPSAGVRMTIEDEGVAVEASRVSPRPDLTPYVDVRAVVAGSPSAPRLSGVRLGAVPVPGSIAARGYAVLDAELRSRFERAGPLLDAIEAVEVAGDAVTVRYVWTEALAQQLDTSSESLVSMHLGRDRLLGYQRALVAAVQKTPRRRPLPLSGVLRPLFEEVKRGVEGGGPRDLEVQAALLVGTLYALDTRLDRIIGEAAPKVPRRALELWGRTDLPKHFLVSALVAAWGDRAFADALGLSKEVTDAEAGGSGFSFVDLAADRAGTQLIERGLTSDAAFEALVERLSARDLEDRALLPDPRDLPEGLTKQALAASGRDVGTPGYDALVEKMDARLDATALHRALRGD